MLKALSVNLSNICLALIVTGCLMMTCPSRAEQLVLNLISESSSLTADGNLPDLGVHTVAQDPSGDSLTTTYSGTITVDVDSLTNPTTITLISASAVAANSGDWLPEPGGGSEGDPFIEGDANPGTAAPANYGFFLDIPGIGQSYSASRETILSLGADTKPMSGGQFDPFGIGVDVLQGIYDSNVSSTFFGDGADTDDVSDESGTNCTDMAGSVNRCGTLMGSYSVAGGVATLTLPLNFILGEGDTIEVTFAGTFVASASVSQPLVGDYNADGAVNAADYVVWRKTNVNGEQGYLDWRANFGQPSGGAAAGSSAVPEPASLALAAFSLLLAWLSRRASC